MIIAISTFKKRVSPEQLFMLSALIVNAGNYAYNLLLGRILGPKQFADAAVLITFLLVLSFVAMTFQLVTAKFSASFTTSIYLSFISKMYKNALITGIILGALIIVFASQLQIIFKTSTTSMFIIFGIGTPLYFLMSVNRGTLQGQSKLKLLSITYQLEMLSRLLITLGLIVLFKIESSILIAIGILVSFAFGLKPIKLKAISFKKNNPLGLENTKLLQHFFIITAFYELTQIIINNSDILLVKHYFETYDAGLYASLALIGRIVYFIAWMFVMLLLPSVIKLKKEGRATTPVLVKYIGYIVAISFVIIFGCLCFPKLVVSLLFGSSYLAIAPLLWKYALATSLFAISNIFAYYYLSLDKYVPVIFSGLFGLLQMGLIICFHDSLQQVVTMQIIAMVLLLAIQMVFFFIDYKRQCKIPKIYT